MREIIPGLYPGFSFFIAKMIIACREARETQYWLRLIDSSEILPPGRLTTAIDEVTQLVAILTAIVKKSRGDSH